MKKLSMILSVALIATLGCADSSTTSSEPDAAAELTAPTESVASPETTETEPVAASGKQDAETVLAAAIKSAAADNKRVLVHLGAPW